MLDKLLLQIPVAAPDTAAANKIQEATNVVTSRVDSLANKLNPDSIAALTPEKIVNEFKYLDLGSLVTSLSSQLISLGLRIIAAILVFYIGKFIINKIYSVARAIMVRKEFERSLTSFLLSFIKITLLFLLIIQRAGGCVMVYASYNQEQCQQANDKIKHFLVIGGGMWGVRTISFCRIIFTGRRFFCALKHFLLLELLDRPAAIRAQVGIIRYAFSAMLTTYHIFICKIGNKGNPFF